jgi:hypothetical protein
VLACEALIIACAVLADVLSMGLGQLLNGGHDGLFGGGGTAETGAARKVSPEMLYSRRGWGGDGVGTDIEVHMSWTASQWPP